MLEELTLPPTRLREDIALELEDAAERIRAGEWGFRYTTKGGYRLYAHYQVNDTDYMLCITTTAGEET